MVPSALSNPRMGEPNMEVINKYIDHCLIQEYGVPNRELNCFELDLDDLPKNEIDNFLHRLMLEDTTVRDVIHCHMQRLIEERLCEVTL